MARTRVKGAEARRRELQRLIAFHSMAGRYADLQKLEEYCLEYIGLARWDSERQVYEGILERFRLRSAYAPAPPPEAPASTAPWLSDEPVLPREALSPGVLVYAPETLRAAGYALDRFAGQQSARRDLNDLVVFPFRNPHMAGSHGIRAPPAVALVGPRHSGKEFATRAVAAELDRPLVEVDVGVLVEEPATVLRRFDAAHQHAADAGGILFVKDLDLSDAASRLVLGPAWALASHVAQAVAARQAHPRVPLTLISYASPDALPDAYGAGGRFRQVSTSAFSADGVRDFVLVFLGRERLAPDLDPLWPDVEHALAGFDAEQLAAALRGAWRRARARGGAPLVRLRDLQEAAGEVEARVTVRVAKDAGREEVR